MLDTDEALDLGSGVLLAVLSQDAQLAGSAARVRQRYAFVFARVDGLIVSVTVYPEADINEARAAAERLAQERG